MYYTNRHADEDILLPAVHGVFVHCECTAIWACGLGMLLAAGQHILLHALVAAIMHIYVQWMDGATGCSALHPTPVFLLSHLPARCTSMSICTYM